MDSLRLNREIKRYCPDFRPIRRILRRLGASPARPKTQVDTYYHLPPYVGQANRRLKLRVERGKRQLIYYVDEYANGLRTVRYAIADADDPNMRALLGTALGVSVVVRKQREVWRLPSVLFNLDHIDAVGPVFETEVIVALGKNGDESIDSYLALFGPYLGAPIEASNEDLALAQAPPISGASRR